MTYFSRLGVSLVTAALLALSNSGPVAAANANSSLMAGWWKGTFACQAGVFGMLVRFEGTKTLRGYADIAPHPANLEPPSAIIEMTVKPSDGGSVELVGESWAKNPKTIPLLSIRGTVDGDRFSGRVLSEECAAVELQRIGDYRAKVRDMERSTVPIPVVMPMVTGNEEVTTIVGIAETRIVDCGEFYGKNAIDCGVLNDIEIRYGKGSGDLFRVISPSCDSYLRLINEMHLVACMAGAYVAKDKLDPPVQTPFSQGWKGLGPLYQMTESCEEFLRITQDIASAAGGAEFSPARATDHYCKLLAQIAADRDIDAPWVRCTLTPDVCALKVADTPDGVRDQLEQVAEVLNGEAGSFDLTNENQAFMAGVAIELLRECPVAIDEATRLELTSFATSGAFQAAGTLDWNSATMTDLVGEQAASVGTLAAGIQSARSLGCIEPIATETLQRIVKLVRANRKGNDGGAAPFMASCSPVHGEASCTCLAEVGRMSVPNIYQLTYSRELVFDLMQRNPITAVSLLSCGISAY